MLRQKYNLLSHSIDFHPIATNHKPNCHINICPVGKKVAES